MKVTVRYFASIREALGASETLDIVPGSSLAALRDRLIASSARHAEVLSRQRAVRAALNQMMVVDESGTIAEGAEVAFFPPVTGG